MAEEASLADLNEAQARVGFNLEIPLVGVSEYERSMCCFHGGSMWRLFCSGVFPIDDRVRVIDKIPHRKRL